MRIGVFADWPNALLILVGEDESSARLPELAPPFSKSSVAVAMAAARIRASVYEGVTGRWTAALHQARQAERAQRGQEQSQREAANAAFMRNSSSAGVSGHAEATIKKLEVDAGIRVLNEELSAARSTAFTTGVYMQRDVFREKDARLKELKQESQLLQVRMGELRRAERRENAKSSRSEAEAFKRAATRVLDRETYMKIDSIALQSLEDEIGDET
jgi:hypothetical protein